MVRNLHIWMTAVLMAIGYPIGYGVWFHRINIWLMICYRILWPRPTNSLLLLVSEDWMIIPGSCQLWHGNQCLLFLAGWLKNGEVFGEHNRTKGFVIKVWSRCSALLFSEGNWVWERWWLLWGALYQHCQCQLS